MSELPGRHNRIDIIDAFRGLSILLMIVHHLAYDLYTYCAAPSWVYFNPVFDIFQPFFAAGFIFVSGISARFSRNNLKRGGEMLLFGCLLSAVTYLFGSPVWFGILHFLGLSAVLMHFLQRYIDRIPLWLAPLIWAAGYSVCSRAFPVWLPGGSTPLFVFLNIIPYGFFSADFFPIFPWIFIYLLGNFFGKFVCEKKLPDYFYKTKIPFLAAVGRNTMWVYLAHQPVIFGILMLFGKVSL